MALFGFLSNRKENDPLLNAKAVQAWWVQVESNDAIGIQLEASKILKDMPLDRLDRNRLHGLFTLDQQLAGARSGLVTQYVTSFRVSVDVEKRLWQSSFDLSQAFINAYEMVLQVLPAKVDPKKWRTDLPLVLTRLIHHRSVDAKFRLFRYEEWIPARWRELHTNYTLACHHRAEREPVPSMEETGQKTTIEQKYLQLLLLHLLNTGSFTPPQLEWVAGRLVHWVEELMLTPRPKIMEGFYVDLTGSEGLRRKRSQPTGGQFLYLDTTALYTRVQQKRAGVAEESNRLGGGQAEQIRQEKLMILTRLASYYAPIFKPIERRSEREAQTVPIHALAGFKSIVKHLQEYEQNKAKRNAPSMAYNYSDARTLHTYGFIHEASAKMKKQEEQAPLQPLPPPGELGQLLDKSRIGCRLVLSPLLLSPLELGSLVVFCAEGEVEEISWLVAIVRRIKKINATQLEAGVELIGQDLARVSLYPQPSDPPPNLPPLTARPPGNPVEQSYDGLWFTAIENQETTVAKKVLLIPQVRHESGKVVAFALNGVRWAILYKQALERQQDWVLSEVEVVREEVA